jgi:hypothetical protein
LCGFSVAAVGEDVRVVAAGVFEGIGQDRHAVEGTVVVDAASERDDGGREPGGIDGDGPEGIAEDVAEQPAAHGPDRVPTVWIRLRVSSDQGAGRHNRVQG